MPARLTNEDRRLRAIPEKDWQQRVLQHLRWNGWLAFHQSSSMRVINVGGKKHLVGDKESKGMLDTFAVHPEHGWILFLELKRQAGSKVTPEQAELIDALANGPLAQRQSGSLRGCRVAVLRPGDRDVLHKLATAPWDVSQKVLPTR